jgi:alpha-glucoside transport system substrate-binding protein
LVVLAALGVAACGDDDDAASNTPRPSGTGATTTGAATATGASQVGGSVDVLGIWGDTELTNFESMIAPWKSEQGAEVAFTGTRSITTDLNTRVDGGSPPDVAIPAETGLFNQYASEGKLKPLSDCPGLEEQVREDYPQSFVDLATVDGELYGFFMKADTKGTIFYNPELFTANNWEPLGDDANFDDLVALSDEIKNSGTVPPWSIGLEAGAGSGFPGTDFIQQVLLNEHGADTYDGIIDGSIPYTDPAMADSWQKFGQIALTEGYTSQGSAQGMIATNFNDATFVPFTDPPGAAMTYLGAFAEGILRGQFPDIEPATDFDFFTFPGGGATGGANIVYAFNTNPTVCSFLSYMASAEAQQIWVDLGGFTSVNTKIPVSSYPGPVAQKAADKLINAPSFRFDLDDAIGGATQQAIFTGITSFLQDPDSLDSILQNIESTRQ